jgi:hypothetical protein
VSPIKGRPADGIPVPFACSRLFPNIRHDPKGFCHRTFAQKVTFIYNLNSDRAATANKAFGLDFFHSKIKAGMDFPSPL